MKKFWKIFILVISISFFELSSAYAFEENLIILDEDLVNYNSMNLTEIQKFLESTKGSLGNFVTEDLEGIKKLASEIIFEASQKYKINPQILLTLIQREKSLLTKPKEETSQDDYNWATGFGCYENQKPISKFRGFARQVDRAAWRLRYYLENPSEFRYQQEQISKTRDGFFIKPKNQATASLYNYAPYLSSNFLFWQIWNKWFKKDQNLPEEGSLLRVKGEKGIWLIENGKRRPFFSKDVFSLRFSFREVKEVSRETLEKYEIGAPMDFPNYSLLQEKESREIYLLSDGKKRKISSELFRKIGFNPEEIILVDKKELERYPEGSPLLSPYPKGALLQDKDTGSVWFVKEETKFPIWAKEILLANFPQFNLIKVDSQELKEFKEGKPLRFRDGTLVKGKNSSTVYVISQGKRQPIISAEVFESLGYNWDEIITVKDEILNLHPLGEIVTINN